MYKQKILFLIALIFFFDCGQKPTVKIKALADESMASEISLPQIQATLSDEDWEKLNAILPTILPRLLALEAAVLLMPQGISYVSSQNAILIDRSDGLNEKSQTLIDLTECVLKEAQKTRELMESLIQAMAKPKN